MNELLQILIIIGLVYFVAVGSAKQEMKSKELDEKYKLLKKCLKKNI